MSKQCRDFQELIPKALLGDIPPEDQRELDDHLSVCAPCARERDLFADTFQQLTTAGDHEIPRHFFVYPEENKSFLARTIQPHSWAWMGALAAAVSVGLLAVLIAMNVEVRAEHGVVTVRLGKPQILVQPATAPVLDVDALKASLDRRIVERSKKDMSEILQTMRAELSRSEYSRGRRERALLQAALTDLEARFSSRILMATATLENNAQRSLANLYTLTEERRQQDLTFLTERLNRIAVTGEIKSNQTDAILDTLLQVAELRLK